MIPAAGHEGCPLIGYAPTARVTLPNGRSSIRWRNASEASLSGKDRSWAGAISALLALTRPEGIVYAGLFPLLSLLTGGNLWAGFLSAAVAAVTWIGYEGFRLLYFGAWVPNTYLAKGGITVARGHAGDNAGRSELVSLLNREQSARARTLNPEQSHRDATSVFGCPLFGI